MSGRGRSWIENKDALWTYGQKRTLLNLWKRCTKTQWCQNLQCEMKVSGLLHSSTASSDYFLRNTCVIKCFRGDTYDQIVVWLFGHMCHPLESVDMLLISRPAVEIPIIKQHFDSCPLCLCEHEPNHLENKRMNPTHICCGPRKLSLRCEHGFEHQTKSSSNIVFYNHQPFGTSPVWWDLKELQLLKLVVFIGNCPSQSSFLSICATEYLSS